MEEQVAATAAEARIIQTLEKEDFGDKHEEKEN